MLLNHIGTAGSTSTMDDVRDAIGALELAAENHGTAMPMFRVICNAAVRNWPESEANDAFPPE
jgi:hypothetical protein